MLSLLQSCEWYFLRLCFATPAVLPFTVDCAFLVADVVCWKHISLDTGESAVLARQWRLTLTILLRRLSSMAGAKMITALLQRWNRRRKTWEKFLSATISAIRRSAINSKAKLAGVTKNTIWGNTIRRITARRLLYHTVLKPISCRDVKKPPERADTGLHKYNTKKIIPPKRIIPTCNKHILKAQVRHGGGSHYTMRG